LLFVFMLPFSVASAQQPMNTPIKSIEPLQDMPFTILDLTGTQVATLAPLKMMKVTELTMRHKGNFRKGRSS
jgi:hypothetical protein